MTYAYNRGGGFSSNKPCNLPSLTSLLAKDISQYISARGMQSCLLSSKLGKKSSHCTHTIFLSVVWLLCSCVDTINLLGIPVLFYCFICASCCSCYDPCQSLGVVLRALRGNVKIQVSATTTVCSRSQKVAILLCQFE